MPPTFRIDVLDAARARLSAPHVRLGARFAFCGEGLPPAPGRLGRLQGYKTFGKRSVACFAAGPIELPGVRIAPQLPAPGRVGCLVCDRDLYRVDEDVANLFVWIPGSRPAQARLSVRSAGEPVTDRVLELDADGAAVASLAGLPSGSYEVELNVDGERLGEPAKFTVAAYTLPPLSARLGAHDLDRKSNKLSFTLQVESYQLPYDRPLQASLLDRGRVAARANLHAVNPGIYRGAFALEGEGPFRIALVAKEDATRTAEVALPGSRARERDAVVVNELGDEETFSLMPEPNAIPVRGGYLARGASLETPLVVEETIAATGKIVVQEDVEALVLAVLDPRDGRYLARPCGNLAAGAVVDVPVQAPMTVVFAGCFVRGEPFEAHTTFFRPPGLGLTLKAPAQARPGTELTIALGAAGATSVLVSVRDERLTATDSPEAALAASLKRILEASRQGLDEGFEYLPLASALARAEPRSPPALPRSGGPRLETPVAVEAISDVVELEPAPEEDADPERRAVAARVLETAAALEMMIKGRAAPEAPPAPSAAPTGKRARTARSSLPKRDKAAPASAPAPQEFPDVLFFGLVPIDGQGELKLKLGPARAALSIEALAIKGSDFMAQRARVQVDQPVRADLEVAPVVHPEDRLFGRLRVAGTSPALSARLTRDGAPVPLEFEGQPVDGAVPSGAVLRFPLAPGKYEATVQEPASGETDVAHAEVGTPGSFSRLARQIRILSPGETLRLADLGESALGLRVLPGLDEPFRLLVEATADYSHKCCEQTAATILAAVVLYLSSNDEVARRRASQIVQAGVARERRMWREGRGFAMYPENKEVHEYYGPKVVRALWWLKDLEGLERVPADLRAAVRDGLRMADDVARALGIQRTPTAIGGFEDAYLAATSPAETMRKSAGVWLEEALARPGRAGRVASRADLGFAAAILLALNKVARALPLANELLGQLNADGRLYSTVDSVPAIAMMLQLRRRNVVAGGAQLVVDGRPMGLAEACGQSDVAMVEVREGSAVVEVLRVERTRWDDVGTPFPVRVGWRDAKGKAGAELKMGDTVQLVASLPQGYRDGDLLHVLLPPALSRLVGGGRLLQFTCDFEGRKELALPLLVSETPDRPQHLSLCVRNMFEEERASSPGPLAIGAVAGGAPVGDGRGVDEPEAADRPAKPGRKGGAASLYIVVEDQEVEKIEQKRYVIGRGKHCDLVINSGRVSREHTAVLKDGEDWFIEDLGSSNGTWFEKQRITRRKIEDGDEYYICSERVKFCLR